MGRTPTSQARGLESALSTHVKIKAQLRVSVTAAVAGGGQRLTLAGCQCRARFRETLSQGNEGGNRKTPNVVLWPLQPHTPQTHTYRAVPTHKYSTDTHIYTLTHTQKCIQHTQMYTLAYIYAHMNKNV